MYKPWPKCEACSRPMSLTRRSSTVEQMVDATAAPNAFACENCPGNWDRPKPKPTFPIVR